VLVSPRVFFDLFRWVVSLEAEPPSLPPCWEIIRWSFQGAGQVSEPPFSYRRSIGFLPVFFNSTFTLFFREEEGLVLLDFPAGARVGISGELQTGWSKWRSVPYSLRVG